MSRPVRVASVAALAAILSTSDSTSGNRALNRLRMFTFLEFFNQSAVKSYHFIIV